MTTDHGCPTCSSKNFGNIEMKKNSDGTSTWKNHCYSCKKFWYSSP